MKHIQLFEEHSKKKSKKEQEEDDAKMSTMIVTAVTNGATLDMGEAEKPQAYYMVTQVVGDFEPGYHIDKDEQEEFLNGAEDVLLGEMSEKDFTEGDWHLYSMPDQTELRYKQTKYVEESSELKDTLGNNYNDYLSDLAEGDAVIMSTSTQVE